MGNITRLVQYYAQYFSPQVLLATVKKFSAIPLLLMLHEGEEAFLAVRMLSCHSVAEKMNFEVEGQKRDCSLVCSLGTVLCYGRSQEDPQVHVLREKRH